MFQELGDKGYRVSGGPFLISKRSALLNMCQTLIELMEDAANEGIQKERIEMAKRMLQEGGFSVEFIARIASLSVEEVQVLAAESA